MTIDIFTLCDNARNYGDKLVIMGSYTNIVTKSFPLTIPEIATVTRIRFHDDEREEYDIQIYLKKENNDTYLITPQKVKANTKEILGKNPVINYIVKANNVVIPEPGVYKMILSINDKIQATSDLYVDESK